MDETAQVASAVQGRRGGRQDRPAGRIRRRAAAGGACLVLFAVLLALVTARWSPLVRFDAGWDEGLHAFALRHPGWAATMRATATIGSPTVLRVLMALVAGWLWLRRARPAALWLAAVCVLQAALETGFKLAVARPRPAFPDPVGHATGWSFPSGHAMTAATLCPLLAMLLWPHARRLRRLVIASLAGLAVLSVSWTRIGLGVHWPSDVLGGWLLAGAVLFGLTAVVDGVRRRQLGNHERGAGEPRRQPATEVRGRRRGSPAP